MNTATFVSSSDLPRKDYETVALCQVSLDDILARKKVKARKRNVKSEGGAYRILAISLEGGRHAQLLEYDARPGTVEIVLEVIETRFAYQADLDAVLALIDVPRASLSWVVTDDVVSFR